MLISTTELRKIARLIDILNEQGVEVVSLGDTAIFDVNGEKLGYIIFDGDDLQYVYSDLKPND